MSDPSIALGAWWSVANADKTVLGVAVALIAVAALAFVARRLLARRRTRA